MLYIIWDVNKLGTLMTSGPKSQLLDDVRCVAWNRQVPHILASTFSSSCVVWDLRKNDSIIKVSASEDDYTHHPNLGSESDVCHLSVAQCHADSDQLLSCGKDIRILVWNPDSGP